ncbi:hypothetical protein QTO34_005507 [Cnephaeus nilssonii]|uniref:Craniofacial development protein 1 n=1 Tax=Cnephaeus nilssonii TaxID=3371016 RepID=A0AA40LI74_CNENI|nr:hypothetical protein QTO34_005507 [Eptesicus nilssonii]
MENKRMDIEFKTMVIRFFKNFMEKADKFNETLEDMKKDQLEIKHTLTEIKNIIQRPNSRLEERKNQLKDLEYKEAKDTPPEKQEEKRIQNVEDSVRSLWDNFKRTNIRIMGVPEEEREQDAENLFEEIMSENFPHLVKEIDLQVQEAHRTPNKRNPKRTTPRHIIIKMPRAKDKERILQAAREKQLVTYKGAPIRLSADFSTETMQARQEWQEIFKVMNSKNLQPRLLYPAKLSFRIEGQIKSFTDKKKLKEFITTKPVLYEMLKGILQKEEKEEKKLCLGVSRCGPVAWPAPRGSDMEEFDSEDISSSEEDEDYVPSGGEYSEDDVNELVKEDEVDEKTGGLSLEEEEEEGVSGESGGSSNEEEDTAAEQEEGTRSEDARKKEDELWASFLNDVGPKSKVPSSPQVKKREETKETSSNKLLVKAEELEKPKETEKVKITKVFDFAGLKRSSGMSSLLGKIGAKKQKMSTLEKSKLDWESFKEEEGIGEELAIHNRGKEGYIERKAFLDRVDHRQFEIERDLRQSKMKP